MGMQGWSGQAQANLQYPGTWTSRSRHGTISGGQLLAAGFPRDVFLFMHIDIVCGGFRGVTGLTYLLR